MSYELVNSPSTQNAVMEAIRDFAVAEGWTNDNYTAGVDGVSRGVMSLHRDDCYVSFRWQGTESDANKSIAMYQALGYSAPNAASPWDQADDSGNGTTSSTNMSSDRRVAGIGPGPFLALHLFGFDDDQISGSTCPTIYCVLEYQAGKYRHFCFGNLDKFGDWTGGEFVCGHEWSATSSNESDPTSNGHSVLLDGLANDSGTGSISDGETATLHAEGLPGQDVLSKWGQVWGDTSQDDDRGGNPRINVAGGCRGSMYTKVFGRFVPSSLTGFIPLMPIPAWYRRDTSGSNQRFYLLGFMPNVRMVQLRAFNPGEEVQIGDIVWKMFPVVAKTNVGGSTTEESENMGIAYIKEVIV